MSKSNRTSLSLLCLCGALMAMPSNVRANSIEDIFGVSARMKGMGGAGTAAANDYSAVYYNPANLAGCDHSRLSMEYNHINYNLSVDSANGDPSAEGLRRRDGMTLGACAKLPLGLALGMMLSNGLQHPQYLSQQTLDAQPRFVMYGQRLEQLSIMGGMAWGPTSWLRVGVGGSAIVNTNVGLNNGIPIATQGQVMASSIGMDLDPSGSIYLGLSVLPMPNLSLGMTYRSSLYHRLRGKAATVIEVTGMQMQMDLYLESVAWYSPQQAAFGAKYDINSQWHVAGDLTWYDWSKYPGPFMRGTPSPSTPLANALAYPPNEAPNFRDIVVPRVGVEYNMGQRFLARGGYSYRPTPAPDPKGVTNLIDGNAHMLSLGAGVYFEGDDLARTGQDGKPAMRPHDVRADLYVSMGIMPERQVTKSGNQPVLNKYSYGGNFYDAGIAVAVGF